MTERISPWAFVPAAAMLIAVSLFYAAPWSEPAGAEWEEVNDKVAQLLATDTDDGKAALPSAADASEENNAAEQTTIQTEAVKSEEKAESDGLININTASSAELDSLQGIGPSKAAAIIAYREENGPFDSVEAILNVKGIGEKMFAKLKAHITTGGPASDKK